MDILQKTLEQYLQREGLEGFTSSKKKSFLSQSIWVLIVSLGSGAISIGFNKPFWTGFIIPIVTYILVTLLSIILSSFVGLFFALRILIKNRFKQIENLDTLIVSQRRLTLLGGVFFILVVAVTSASLSIYMNSWLVIPVLIFVFVIAFSINILLLSGTFIVKAIFDILGKPILSTMPLLLITIILSIFSGDIWLLIGNMSRPNLILLTLILFVPLFLAILTVRRPDLSDFLDAINSPADIVRQVFSLPVIQKLKKKQFICIEDEQEVTKYLAWRSIPEVKEIVFNKLQAQIKNLHFQSIFIAAVVFGIAFFVLSSILFWVISPDLYNMGWLAISRPINLPGLEPILKVAFFISVIQITAFLARLFEKKDNNVLLHKLKDKSSDWISSIIMYQALLLPNAVIVEKFRKREGTIKKWFWFSQKIKIIVKETLSNPEVEDICKTVLALDKSQKDKIVIIAFKNSNNIFDDLKRGSNEWNWEYIHNFRADLQSFSPVPESVNLDDENHLLGRDKYLKGEKVPESWFGMKGECSRIGLHLWQLDSQHTVIMHPLIWEIKDKRILNIEIRLFKKFPRESDYVELAKTALRIALEEISSNPLRINVFFYYRYEEKSNSYATYENAKFIYTNHKRKTIVIKDFRGK